MALGASVPGAWGGPPQALERALAELSSAGLHVVKRSCLWRSAAWPDPADPPFLNAVALVSTGLSPAEALARLHGLEREAGRARTAANAPRPLDLDLVAWGVRVDAGPPTLPHPRGADRRFVMGPLAEIAPGWRHPVLGRSAVELAAAATVGADARPV